MGKLKRIIINCVLLVFLNNLYTTIYMMYPKVIFEPDSLVSTTTVWGLFFWIVYNLILIVIFGYNEQIFSAKLYKEIVLRNRKNIAIKLLLLFFVQIMYDFAVSYLCAMTVGWKYILIDIISFVHWIVVYIIVADEKKRIIKRSKTRFIVLVAVGIVIITSIYFDYRYLVSYSSLVSKFKDNSPYLLQYLKNEDFIFNNIKLFFVDCFVVCFSVIYHYSELEFGVKKAKLSVEVIRTFVCWMAMIILGVVINSMLSSVFPHNILTTEGRNVSYEYYKSGSPLDYSKNDYSIINKASNTQFFTLKKVCFLKEGQTIAQFNFNTYEANCVFGDFEHEDDYLLCKIDDEKIYIYQNEAICFYDNEKAKLVKFSDLKYTQENNKITEVCKILLKEGNLFVFEYGYEYLLDYEPDFIKPYIERYAVGKFTLKEQRWMDSSYYREQYIIDIAKDLVK